jgi:transcriptional regulator with XRE-family HTH domain
MEMTGEISGRIEKLRKARGLSQVGLAEILKLNPQTIRDYEKGRRSPTIKGLPALARALDVSISELIEGSDTPPPVRSLPVSETLKKMAAIPDRIYDQAQGIPKDHEIWEVVYHSLGATKEDMQKLDGNKESI